MITEALLHCHGIGPVRLGRLHASGIRSWSDVLERSNQIPAGYRDTVTEESRRCLAALDGQNVRFLVDHFCTKDQWRILDHYIDQTSFFDIETVGLELDDPITVIVCWHDGSLHTFVEHENLDDFLVLLDQVTLLASFNGSAFDVPRVLNGFHVPELPCAHLDLRWPCYHRGYTGGLKEIASRWGIVRPADLRGTDGRLATLLWSAWHEQQDAAARNRLVRYCAADVLMLLLLAQRLVGQNTLADADAWSHLPSATAWPMPGRPASPADETPAAGRPSGGPFGQGSPSRLRGRRRRRVG